MFIFDKGMFKIWSDNAAFEPIGQKDSIFEFKFKYAVDKESVPDTVRITFSYPCIDVYSVWYPTCKFQRYLKPYFDVHVNQSRTASGAPVFALIGQSGKNKLTISISDGKMPINIMSGVSEDTATLNIYIDFFAIPVGELKEYEAIVRFDVRDIPYYMSIADAEKWWNNFYPVANIPEEAKYPVYSTWYSYHQKIDTEDIIKQCRIMSRYGAKSVIVDDGWQTEDSNGGYAYCGDWQVTKTKIPDMKKFVSDVHDTGLKFILWYSVPFVGMMSHKWEEFKDMTLDPNSSQKWKCLDIRYKEVREYLIDTYKSAVIDWDLDGFKLDFIDSSKLTEDSVKDAPNEGFIKSLEDAMEIFLRDVNKELSALKPGILIEFRQSYMGPVVRSAGNMLRVADCPNDAHSNKKGVVDLRITSGKTPVHSDMLMWNYNDTPESAAKQIINVLFSVPQISVRLDKLNDSHFKMFEFYMSLWMKYRHIFIDEPIAASSPECNYTKIWAMDNNTEIILFSADTAAELERRENILINGSGNEIFYISSDSDFNVIVYDCMGNVISEETCFAGNTSITIPESGLAKCLKS